MVPQEQREVLEALVKEAGRSHVQCKTTNSSECEANMYRGGGEHQLLYSPSNPLQSLWLWFLIGPLNPEHPPTPRPPWGPLHTSQGPERSHPGGETLTVVEVRQDSLERIDTPLPEKGSLTTDRVPKGRPLPLQSWAGEGAWGPEGEPSFLTNIPQPPFGSTGVQPSVFMSRFFSPGLT